MYSLLLTGFLCMVVVSHVMCAVVYEFDPDALAARKPEHEINPLILSRFSNHEFVDEDVPEEDLQAMFEAFRWAPSQANVQAWHIVYTKRNTTQYEKLFKLLEPFNQDWAKGAGALAVIASNHNASQYASFDTGSAWVLLALEGEGRGLGVHPVASFDIESSYKLLNIPKDKYKIEIIAVIGKRPPKAQRKYKEQISNRVALKSIVSLDEFK